MIYSEALEIGTEYLVKLTYKSRKKRYTYKGISKANISETEYIDVYRFECSNDNIKVTDEHIESIEIAKPLKEKEKKGITCTRCLGNKVYTHFAHVNGGRCFKCGGTGII